MTNSVNYVLRRKGVGVKIGAIEEYSQTGLKVIRSDKIPENRGMMEEAAFCFRWGTTATIPASNVVVSVNGPASIHRVFDKRMFRYDLFQAGLSMQTWIDFGDFLESWIDTMENGPGIVGAVKFPVLLRPEQHIRSLDINVCTTAHQVYKASKKYERYYISEYVKKDKEYRVFVVSGRVMAVVEKLPRDRDEVSWGCVEEGSFKYVPWSEWPLLAAQKALDAVSLSGLDFGAVDVISLSTPPSGANAGATGLSEAVAFVLEINTAPELTPYYLKSLTKCFDYIVENGTQKLPITNDGWRGMIHPAISSDAV